MTQSAIAPAAPEHPGAPAPEIIDQLEQRLSLSGIELERSDRRIAEYTYDGSIFRIPPAGVVYPRTAADIRATVKACADLGVPITARGGGTTLAGNAIGRGIIIDSSRHMRQVSELDAESMSVRAGGGVILSELKKQVERESGGTLTFAPDPSSYTRATVCGSIGNDACGNHSVKYGRISDSIIALEVVTADGAHLNVGKGEIHAVDPSDAHSVARAATLERELRELAQANLAAFRTQLETIPRQVSGYHLAKLLPERGFNAAAALAGSEGTCAIIVDATLAVVPKPAAVGLLVVGYTGPVEMAKDVPAILEFGPSAIEGIEISIVEAMRARRGEASVRALPNGESFLFIEVEADSADEANERSAEILERLRGEGRMVDGAVVTSLEERALLWRVREDGAGLASRPLDGNESWAGWEDSAVAPERLGEYLADLRALLNSFGYSGAMYGHFGAGCMHIRIDFDLRTEHGLKKYREFMEAAARLVVAHGGSLSGEHGDGRARGELLPIMYSEEMMRTFATYKRIWDPTNLLNPGILVDSEKLDDNLAIVGVPKREWRTQIALIKHDGKQPPEGVDPFVHAAQACVGVGRCRTMSGSFMCPSYRATNDEKDSTRGRSRVLQEMVRGARTVKEGWRSPEVREALDLCLSCKACASDCPTGVDMAALKSAFYNEYYDGRVRPRSHYTVGRLPMLLPLATALAPIANWAMNTPLRYIVAAVAGVTTKRRFPTFTTRKAFTSAVERAGLLKRKPAKAGVGAGGAADATDAVLLVDSFTKAFRPHLIEPAARVLGDANVTASCEADECCGLTWISTGQLDGAKRRLSSLVDSLDDGTDRPIVVVEPSCASAIKHDGPSLLESEAARRVAARTRSFADFVREQMDAGWQPSATPPAEVALQPHCHEYSSFGPLLQRSIYEKWGVEKIVQSTSCCGLAGNFGMEAEHYETSMKVAEHSMGAMLNGASESACVATDGFSCVTQLDHLAPDREGKHIAELLDPGADRAPAGDAAQGVSR